MSLLHKLLLMAVVLVLAFSAVWSWSRIEALRGVEEENRRAAKHSTAVRDRAAACFDAGGMWDFAASKCRGASAGPGK